MESDENLNPSDGAQPLSNEHKEQEEVRIEIYTLKLVLRKFMKEHKVSKRRMSKKVLQKDGMVMAERMREWKAWDELEEEKKNDYFKLVRFMEMSVEQRMEVVGKKRKKKVEKKKRTPLNVVNSDSSPSPILKKFLAEILKNHK